MSGTIYVIRHAEKPDDDANIHLSFEGQRRAAALVKLFCEGGRFQHPQFLFAAKRSKHSNRSVETLEPLADNIDEDIDHGYDEDEYKDLAKRLKSGKKYTGATILICWHHDSIPKLARALGVPKRALPVREWPDDDFDSIWILDFDAAGLAVIHNGRQRF